MLENLIKEIQELMEYKKKYGHAMADGQKMSDALYDLYFEKYNNQTFEERKEYYIRENCKDCRGKRYDCDCSIIPSNVGMPIKSDKAWFPAKIGCKEFKYS